MNYYVGDNQLAGAACEFTSPLSILKRFGNLERVVPNITERAELQKFLHDFLTHTASPEQKESRDQARAAILKRVECDRAPASFNPNIRAVVFDTDHTKGLLYPISSTTGHWALSRMIEENGLKHRAKDIFAAAKNIEPEFLCHASYEFTKKLAEKTGLEKELNPDSKRNAPIMQDWRDASDVLNKQFVFRGVLNGIERIKREGGMVYAATLASPANTFHRFFIWFGAENAVRLFDGIAIRAPIPGMSPDNKFASPEEKAFVGKLHKANKVIYVPDEHMKPKGEHLLYVLKHANEIVEKKAPGAPKITPKEMVMVGDSFGSDGNSARDLKRLTGQAAQFAYTAQGIVVCNQALKAHEIVGHPIDVLGPDPVLKKLESGDYPKPQIAISDFNDFFNHYRVKMPW